MMRFSIAIIGLTLLLVACGKPNASGIYVSADDGRVTLVQLVQADDGKLTGRVEESSIAADGTIATKEAMVDGSVSGNELMLRPASAWFGGIQASGTVSGNKLTLTNKSATLVADRASLEKYQEAVAKLQGNAGVKQQEVAEAKAQTAEYKARFDAANALADKKAQLAKLSANLSDLAQRLNNAVSNSPDFGKKAAANTARISQLVDRARGQSDLARNQIGVAANQIEVDTNQIEVARSQYALQLNELVESAKQTANSIGGLCGSNPPANMSSECGAAMRAVAAFKEAADGGAKNFNPYKQQLQVEIERQNRLAQGIDG